MSKTGNTKVKCGSTISMNHARILLKADINHEVGGWTDSQISESLDIGHATIERVRQRFVEEGMESALSRREQKNVVPQ
jgi:transposase